MLLLTFWAAWFLIVFSTNVADFLIYSGILPHNILYGSHNREFLLKVFSIYHTSTGLVNAIFLLGCIFEGMIAILFATAAYAFFKGHLSKWQWTQTAFLLSFFFLIAFILMDEILIAYQLEKGHLLLLILNIVSFIAILAIEFFQLETSKNESGFQSKAERKA